MQESGGLQSTGCQRVRHDRANLHFSSLQSYFRMNLTFKSIDWVKQIIFCNVGGPFNQLKAWVEQKANYLPNKMEFLMPVFEQGTGAFFLLWKMNWNLRSFRSWACWPVFRTGTTSLLAFLVFRLELGLKIYHWLS